MATILEFKSAPRPAAASLLSACQVSAEIVFFPGVRYDRPSEDGVADDTKARRHREEPELED